MLQDAPGYLQDLEASWRSSVRKLPGPAALCRWDPGGTRSGPGRDPGRARSGPGRDPGPQGSRTAARRHRKGTLRAAVAARGDCPTLVPLARAWHATQGAHNGARDRPTAPRRGCNGARSSAPLWARVPPGSRPGPVRVPPGSRAEGKRGASHAVRAVSEPQGVRATTRNPSLCPQCPAQPPREPHGHRTAPGAASLGDAG